MTLEEFEEFYAALGPGNDSLWLVAGFKPGPNDSAWLYHPDGWEIIAGAYASHEGLTRVFVEFGAFKRAYAEIVKDDQS